MTDYLYDTYRRRCFKEYRDILETRGSIPLSEVTMEEFVETPAVKNFYSCLISPLVPKEIRDPFFNCLKKKNGDVEKCPKTWFNFYKKGVIELNDLVMTDLSGLVKTKLAKTRCETMIKRAKENRCVSHSENPICQEIREKAFHCIIKSSCKELNEMSVKCFKDSQREDEGGFFRGVITGENNHSRIRREEFCSSIQKDYLNCFEKYFLMAQVTVQDQRLQVRVGKYPRPLGIQNNDVIVDKLNTKPSFYEKIEESDDE